MNDFYLDKNNSYSLTKINLFQEIFVESNPARLDEYVYCLNKNLSNSCVRKLFLVVNKEEYDSNLSYFNDLLQNKLKSHEKINLIKNDHQRFTFNKLVDFSKEYFVDNSIVMAANLDIFLPDTKEWKNLYKDFFKSTDKKVCLALARTEFINEDQTFIDETAWGNGEFSDAWCLITPFQIDHSDFPYDIPVGFAPSCDNHMFVILGKKYDHVFNWADKYKIYHYDVVRKPDVIHTRRGRMIINEKTYKLPDHDQPFLKSNFVKSNLPAKYDWQSLFNQIKK